MVANSPRNPIGIVSISTDWTNEYSNEGGKHASITDLSEKTHALSANGALRFIETNDAIEAVKFRRSMSRDDK